MTDTFDSQDDDTQTDDLPDKTGFREEVKRGRQAVKERDEAVERAAAAEKRAVMAEAGIPTDGVGALFRKAYDGDLSPEAIKAEWQTIAGGTPQPQDETPSEELERLRRMQAGVREANEPDPAAEQEYFQKLEALKREWKPGREADLVDGVSAAIQDAQNRGLPVRLAQ